MPENVENRGRRGGNGGWDPFAPQEIIPEGMFKVENYLYFEAQDVTLTNLMGYNGNNLNNIGRRYTIRTVDAKGVTLVGIRGKFKHNRFTPSNLMGERSKNFSIRPGTIISYDGESFSNREFQVMREDNGLFTAVELGTNNTYTFMMDDPKVKVINLTLRVGDFVRLKFQREWPENSSKFRIQALANRLTISDSFGVPIDIIPISLISESTEVVRITQEMANSQKIVIKLRENEYNISNYLLTRISRAQGMAKIAEQLELATFLALEKRRNNKKHYTPKKTDVVIFRGKHYNFTLEGEYIIEKVKKIVSTNTIILKLKDDKGNYTYVNSREVRPKDKSKYKKAKVIKKALNYYKPKDRNGNDIWQAIEGIIDNE